MHTLPIDVNRRQLNKLMKGGRVRVNKGTGFNLIVHPERYTIVSRAFAKNKGSEVQLTPEEIQMNQYDEEESESEEEEEEYEAEARRMGNIGQGLRGRGATGSMLKNTAANATANLINAGSDRAANEMTTQGTGFRRSRGGSLKTSVAQAQLANELNQHLGSNYGYLSRAGLDNAINGNKNAAMIKMGIDARHALSPVASDLRQLGPRSRLVGGTLVEKSTLGARGTMLAMYTPPALVSQPFSANFQMQHFLPPQYQHFNSGGANITGNGLYV
jgi:hypothetical protein